MGKPLPYATRSMFPPFYAPKPSVSWRTVSKTIAAMLMIVFIGQIILQLGTLIYGVGIVGPAILDGHDIASYTLFIVLPVFINLFTISGSALFAYYLFIVAAIVASVIWIFLTSAKGFLLELKGKAKPREHSAFFDTAALLFATLFFSFVVSFLVAIFGGSLGEPSTGTIADILFALANASVWEELAVRVLLIGVPLLVIDLVRRSHKKWHKYLLGSGIQFGIAEVVLLVVSSMIFGIAHYVGGWGLWKITPAAVAGLAFGYLFLRHGLAAAVMMHFGTDYFSMPSQVFSTDTGALTMITIVLELFWVAVGAVFFAYFITRMAEFFSGKPIMAETPAPVGALQFAPGANPYAQYQPHYVIPQPQAQTPNPHVTYHPGVQHGYGGYVCPVCGYTQARWLDGRFQCLRCGNLS